MSAIAWISERFNWLTGYFYDAYREILDLPYPFWYAAWPFYLVSETCSQIAWQFYYFSDWVYYVENRVRNILTWEGIWYTILHQVPNLLEIRDWFYSWWGYVHGVVTAWWASTQDTVQSWIDIAVSRVERQVEVLERFTLNLESQWYNFAYKIPLLDMVVSWWFNWTGNVLSTVNTWWAGALLDVQGLIDSAFTVRESMWAGWQDMRNQVVEFFADPEDQVLKILERALERFW